MARTNECLLIHDIISSAVAWYKNRVRHYINAGPYYYRNYYGDDMRQIRMRVLGIERRRQAPEAIRAPVLGLEDRYSTTTIGDDNEDGYVKTTSSMIGYINEESGINNVRKMRLAI